MSAKGYLRSQLLIVPNGGSGSISAHRLRPYPAWSAYGSSVPKSDGEVGEVSVNSGEVHISTAALNSWEYFKVRKGLVCFGMRHIFLS